MSIDEVLAVLDGELFTTQISLKNKFPPNATHNLLVKEKSLILSRNGVQIQGEKKCV